MITLHTKRRTGIGNSDWINNIKLYELKNVPLAITLSPQKEPHFWFVSLLLSSLLHMRHVA